MDLIEALELQGNANNRFMTGGCRSSGLGTVRK